MQIFSRTSNSLALSGLLLCFAASMNNAAEDKTVTAISIPKIPEFELDGSITEWKDRGILITQFSEDALPGISSDIFSAQVRVAWIDAGLIVATNLKSSVGWEENDSMRNAYNKDSLELFLRTGSAWRNLVQAVVAPGFDKKFDDARSYMWDYRGNPEAWADEPAHVKMSRSIHGNSGIIEVLIPWRQLRLEASVGSEVEFRININKIIPNHGRRQFTWRRADGEHFQKLILAENTESIHVDSSAWIIDSDPYHVGFAVSSKAENAGQTFELKQGDKTLLSSQLVKEGHSSNAVYWLPHSSIPANGEALRVELHKNLLASHMVKNPIPDLRLQIERAFIGRGYRGNKSMIDRLSPQIPGVLNQDAKTALPQATIQDPELAIHIGLQTLTTNWFDNSYQAVTHAKEAGRYAAVSTATFTDGATLTHYQSAVKLPVASYKTIAGSLGLAENDLASLQSSLENGVGTDKSLVTKIGVALQGGADHPQEAHNKWMHELRRSLGTEIVYPFAERLPKDYGTDKEKLWPAIIYLHGSSGKLPSQQSPIEERISTAPNRDLLGWAGGNPRPFALFALQSNGGWEPDAVMDTVDRILAAYQVDPDRLIIMGFSMGGMGTWRCAVEKADRWAAAVPIAARGDQAHHVERVGKLPIWVVNGDADRTTTLADAMQIVNAMKEKNIAHTLTVLPGVGHGGSQNGTFNTEGIWEWLAAQKRSHR